MSVEVLPLFFPCQTPSQPRPHSQNALGKVFLGAQSERPSQQVASGNVRTLPPQGTKGPQRKLFEEPAELSES